MKKYILILSIFSLLLVSCNKKIDNDNNETKTNDTTTSPNTNSSDIIDDTTTPKSDSSETTDTISISWEDEIHWG